MDGGASMLLLYEYYERLVEFYFCLMRVGFKSSLHTESIRVAIRNSYPLQDLQAGSSLTVDGGAKISEAFCCFEYIFLSYRKVCMDRISPMSGSS